MRVIRELDEARIAELHRLYQNEWWSRSRSLEETTAGVKGSQACYGILSEDGELIAFTRVLTDFIFKALIFDVIVRKDYRGNGLGNELLSLVKTDPDLAKVRHFELYCLPEMIPLYEKHGFSTDVSGVQLMRFTANQ